MCVYVLLCKLPNDVHVLVFGLTRALMPMKLLMNIGSTLCLLYYYKIIIFFMLCGLFLIQVMNDGGRLLLLRLEKLSKLLK